MQEISSAKAKKRIVADGAKAISKIARTRIAA